MNATGAPPTYGDLVAELPARPSRQQRLAAAGAVLAVLLTARPELPDCAQWAIGSAAQHDLVGYIPGGTGVARDGVVTFAQALGGLLVQTVQEADGQLVVSCSGTYQQVRVCVWARLAPATPAPPSPPATPEMPSAEGVAVASDPETGGGS